MWGPLRLLRSPIHKFAENPTLNYNVAHFGVGGIVAGGSAGQEGPELVWVLYSHYLQSLPHNFAVDLVPAGINR